MASVLATLALATSAHAVEQRLAHTASTTAPGAVAAGAMDGDRFAVANEHLWKADRNDAAAWWQVDFGAPRRIGAILQVNGDDEAIFKNAPVAYRWLASDDGQAWRPLDGAAQKDERRLYRLHRLPTAVEVRMLRLEIAAHTGEAPALREVEFYERPDAEVAFPDWVVCVSTEESRTLPFECPRFINLVHACPDWRDVQAQHVWLDTFDIEFVAAEPRPLCAFLTGNLADWCQRTREPWRGAQQILEQGALPIWASCGGAQGLAILAETGVDRPWDCPHCRDPDNPKLLIYGHIGHTAERPCGDYSGCVFERGRYIVRQTARDPAFAGIPLDFATIESHCGQIEYPPSGWTLVVTNGPEGKTRTQCIRRNDRPIYAAQFHIELDGTPETSRPIMANFLAIAKAWGGYNPNATPIAPPQPLESVDSSPAVSRTERP